MQALTPGRGVENETGLPLDIIHLISDAALLVGRDGELLARNELAAGLPDEAIILIEDGRDPTVLLAEFDNWREPRRLEFDGATLWIIPLIDNRAGATVVLLDQFIKGLAGGLEAHRALGLAIRAALGWQWVAVCRILDDEQFEILTWVDGEEVEGPMIEQLAGTACEIVLKHERFIYFKDIADAFDDDEYAQMGARIYAGLGYRVDGAATGHLFALHHSDRVDIGVADAVLSLATELLGSHLSMLAARQKVEELEDAASTDALTGLGNRHALERLIEKLDPSMPISIAVIDLDGLKIVNDTHGHEAGDQLLRDFARGLRSISRQQDRLFRYGGDEFVLVVEDQRRDLAHALSVRLDLIVGNLGESDVREVGASVGVAALDETGNFRDALILADHRMYANKRTRRRQRGA